jgi:hypothetical protein
MTSASCPCGRHDTRDAASWLESLAALLQGAGSQTGTQSSIVGIVDLAKLVCFSYGAASPYSTADTRVVHPLAEAAVLLRWAEQGSQAGPAQATLLRLLFAPEAASGSHHTHDGVTSPHLAPLALVRNHQIPLFGLDAETVVRFTCALLGHDEEDWSPEFRRLLDASSGAWLPLAVKHRGAYLTELPLAVLAAALARGAAAAHEISSAAVGRDGALDSWSGAAFAAARAPPSWSKLEGVVRTMARVLELAPSSELTDSTTADAAFANRGLVPSAVAAVAARVRLATTDTLELRKRGSVMHGTVAQPPEAAVLSFLADSILATPVMAALFDGDDVELALRSRRARLDVITPFRVANFCRAIASAAGGMPTASKPQQQQPTTTWYANPWCDHEWIAARFDGIDAFAGELEPSQLFDAMLDRRVGAEPMRPMKRDVAGSHSEDLTHATTAAHALLWNSALLAHCKRHATPVGSPTTGGAPNSFVASGYFLKVDALHELVLRKSIADALAGPGRTAVRFVRAPSAFTAATPSMLPLEHSLDPEEAELSSDGTQYHVDAFARALAAARNPTNALLRRGVDRGIADGATMSECTDALQSAAEAAVAQSCAVSVARGALLAHVGRGLAQPATFSEDMLTANQHALRTRLLRPATNRLLSSAQELLWIAKKYAYAMVPTPGSATVDDDCDVTVARVSNNAAAVPSQTHPQNVDGMEASLNALTVAARRTLEEFAARSFARSVVLSCVHSVTVTSDAIVAQRALLDSRTPPPPAPDDGGGESVSAADAAGPATHPAAALPHREELEAAVDDLSRQCAALQEHVEQRQALAARAAEMQSTMRAVAAELRTDADRAWPLAERELAEKQLEYQEALHAAAKRAGEAVGLWQAAELAPVLEQEADLARLGDPAVAARRAHHDLEVKKDQLQRQLRALELARVEEQYALIGRWDRTPRR